MEEAKLLRRVPVPSDWRSFRVEPTPCSGARRAAVIEALIAVEDGPLAGLDRAECAQLLRLLAKVGSDGGDG